MRCHFKRRQFKPLLAVAVALGGALAGPPPALAADLVDAPVFTATKGELSVLLVAKAHPGVDVGDGKPFTAWTYEVCKRPRGDKPNACPRGTGQNPFGGVRLELDRRDVLRIRLVNALPPVLDSDHAKDTPSLASNPTNLHTHGLIVEPHRAENARDYFGDYVFLDITQFAAAQTAPPAASPRRLRLPQPLT